MTTTSKLPTKKKSKNDLNTLRERLRLLRFLHNMTQNDVAKKLNLTFQQYQKYEKGSVQISISTLNTICEIYNVNINVFLCENISVEIIKGKIFINPIK